MLNGGFIMEKEKLDYRVWVNNVFFTAPLLIVLILFYGYNMLNIRDEIGIVLFVLGLLGIVIVINLTNFFIRKVKKRLVRCLLYVLDFILRLVSMIGIAYCLYVLFDGHETRQFFALGLVITYIFGIIIFYSSYVPKLFSAFPKLYKLFSNFPKLYKLKEPIIIGYGLYILLFLLHVWGQVDISIISFLTALLAIAYHLCSEKVRLLVDIHVTKIDDNIKRLFYISKLFALTLASLSLLSLYLITTASDKKSIHFIFWNIHLKDKAPYNTLLSVGYFRVLFVLIMLFILISVYIIITELAIEWYTSLFGKLYKIDYPEYLRKFSNEEFLQDVLMYLYEDNQFYNNNIKKYYSFIDKSDIESFIEQLEANFRSQGCQPGKYGYYVVNEIKVRMLNGAPKQPKYYQLCIDVSFLLPSSKDNFEVCKRARYKTYCQINEIIEKSKIKYKLRI